jgi:isopropanol dehydrogenase (NADP+)
MKGFAMLRIGEAGWVEKDKPKCGEMDAIIKLLACSPCTSDIHTVYAGAIGERKNVILGHEAVGEIAEVGKLVKDFKEGDKVIVPAVRDCKIIN